MIIHELSTAPTSEPIGKTETKNHLRIISTDEDNYIDALIVAARKHIESTCNLALITQTWKMYLPRYTEVITLLKSPLQSVTSIQYVDEDGATQTEASSVYTVDSVSIPGLIYPAYDQSWSSTRSIPKAITVTYVAGYGDPEDVPEPIKQAMLLLIGHLYENREASAPVVLHDVPMAVDSLLAPYRVHYF